ncbi:MAG: SH3 domain-containing protein [Gemmatimonadaceae bacterium]
MRSRHVLLAAALVTSACSSAKSTSPNSRGTPAPKSSRPERDTVIVRDPELEKRVGRLEIRLLEKEAQVEDLQARLNDARAEVVRAMAKLPTAANRAQAASGMAEAEVALQSLKSSAAPRSPEVAQVTAMMRQSATEFDERNYSGALYLANQAKAVASSYRGPVAEGNRKDMRAGEAVFALPIRLSVTSRGNVRQGPGTSFSIEFAVEPGTVLTGLSYTDDWIRVHDESGRSGWIFRSLVARP